MHFKTLIKCKLLFFVEKLTLFPFRHKLDVVNFIFPPIPSPRFLNPLYGSIQTLKVFNCFLGWGREDRTRSDAHKFSVWNFPRERDLFP